MGGSGDDAIEAVSVVVPTIGRSRLADVVVAVLADDATTEVVVVVDRNRYETDAILVRRHTVPGGTVQRDEALDPVERALLLEDVREAGQRDGRGEAAGAAASAELQRIGMRRAVGAGEEPRVARDGGGA